MNWLSGIPVVIGLVVVIVAFIKATPWWVLVLIVGFIHILLESRKSIRARHAESTSPATKRAAPKLQDSSLTSVASRRAEQGAIKSVRLGTDEAGALQRKRDASWARARAELASQRRKDPAPGDSRATAPSASIPCPVLEDEMRAHAELIAQIQAELAESNRKAKL